MTCTCTDTQGDDPEQAVGWPAAPDETPLIPRRSDNAHGTRPQQQCEAQILHSAMLPRGTRLHRKLERGAHPARKTLCRVAVRPWCCIAWGDLLFQSCARNLQHWETARHSILAERAVVHVRIDAALKGYGVEGLIAIEAIISLVASRAAHVLVSICTWKPRARRSSHAIATDTRYPSNFYTHWVYVFGRETLAPFVAT